MPATRHSASHRRHHSLLAWLVLLASLTPTFYAWWWIRRHLAQNNEGSFWAWVVLTAGLGVSTLLFSLLWLQDRRQRDLELANEALRRRDAEFVVLNAELERRIAERTAQLRLANEDLSRFKTIADATSDFINITDVEGRVLYMNPAGRRLIGAQPDEDVTQLCINDLIPQHTRELFEQVGFPAALRDGYWRGETDFRHRDGHLFPVSLVGIIVRTPDGRPLFMGCIARDVTEQRRMANELTAALAEERELNRLKSNFISMVTHEIRTPLSLILGSSEILSRYLDRLTAEKRAQHLQTIDSSVQRMSGLLEDVLLFSKAEAGRMEFNPIEMDLKQF
ncbi:MAG TPA: histidine kinase dimerization/phospho-acceptor domain-containing protein, partial [Verrucomicrobiae bacterium]